MKMPEKRIVNLEDRPGLEGLVEHVGYSYLRHSVEVRRDGQPIAVLLDVEAAHCALSIADRLRNCRPPFTHAVWNKWLDEVLEGFDVTEILRTKSRHIVDMPEPAKEPGSGRTLARQRVKTEATQ